MAETQMAERRSTVPTRRPAPWHGPRLSTPARTQASLVAGGFAAAALVAGLGLPGRREPTPDHNAMPAP